MSTAVTGAMAALREECAARLAPLDGLPDKPEETREAALAALWLAAAGTPCSADAASTRHLPDLDPAAATRLRGMIARRLEGVPLAHLTGRQRFLEVELESAPDALIPRRETEVLGRAALGLLREMQGSGLVVIDLCTGSGNVALAIAVHEPRARVSAADLSPDAVALARRNVGRCALRERVTVEAGDLLAPFDDARFHGAVDLITCNPPYISSAKVDTLPAEIAAHEPRLAFDGGPLGIRILNRLVQEAPLFLRDGGWLAFEVGLGQARGMRRRLEQVGAYDAIQEATDAQDVARALLARRKSR